MKTLFEKFEILEDPRDIRGKKYLSTQNKYYQIVKDREFYGYKLPKDMIVVLTVKDREGLKNISKELYNFCVIAF